MAERVRALRMAELALKKEQEIKAGGDFAEEIIGHWALWIQGRPTAKELDDLKRKIRHFCIPKSRVRAEIAKLLEIPDFDWEDVTSESYALCCRLLDEKKYE